MNMSMNKEVAGKPPAVQVSYSDGKGDNLEVIDIAQYWRTVKRAKWSIIAVILCCLIVGGVIASMSVPVYKASAKILADPQQPNADRNEQFISSKLLSLYYETQYEIISSRKIAESVVDNLGLVEQFKQANLASASKQVSGLSAAIDYAKTEFNALFNNANQTTKPEPTDTQIKKMLAAEIQENINVSGGKQSQIINISYTSSDPQNAAKIINAVSDAYIQFGLDSRIGEVKQTENWLGDQFASLKEKLQNSETKLSTYRLQQGLVDTSQQQRIANTQLQSLNNELVRAQTQLSAAKEQYLAVKDIEPGSRELYSLGPVLENNSASDMVKEESFLSRKVNEYEARYGEKHPKMIAARSDLQSAQINLASEVNKVVDNIEKNFRLAQVQVTNISKLIDITRNDIQSLQTENFSLSSLEREVENNRRAYESFQTSLMETSGQSEFTASNVQIIDRATPPEAPFKPNVKLIMLISGIFGVVIGVSLAYIRESLDNTFKTPDALGEKLKIPVLGITPFVRKKKGIAKPEKQYLHDIRSPFSESINTIRTGLLFSNIDSPPKTILVTSATGSEGKSTLAMNLAASYSNIGRTLLLEVDLRKPSVANNLDIKIKIGLTDLITGNVAPGSDVIFTNNDEKLSIITCGTIPKNPLEVLSSKRFDRLLNKLRNHFEYIILDGPPTLPVSDSSMLANKVDGVIIAVKAEDTNIKVAKEAVTRLQNLNANIIGAVLTVAEASKMEYYGSHYTTGKYYGVSPKKEYA